MNDKITLRSARPDDAKALLEIYSPYILHTAITFEYVVPSEAEFAARIENTLRSYPYIVAECAGEVIGYAYASRLGERAAYNWSAEVSIYIKNDRRRAGLGRLLYTALEDLLKAQGLVKLAACIARPETEDEYLTNNSIRFHEKMGYTDAGTIHFCGHKFGRWYHTIWMEKTINPMTADIAPVRVVDEAATRAILDKYNA